MSTKYDYKKEVIDAAISGMVSGGMTHTQAQCFEALLTRVYESGYNEAKIQDFER